MPCVHPHHFFCPGFRDSCRLSIDMAIVIKIEEVGFEIPAGCMSVGRILSYLPPCFCPVIVIGYNLPRAILSEIHCSY